MFARHVTIKLKADCVERFALIIEDRVLPLLREQPGFLDHTTLISVIRWEAIVITFWDTRESEEYFNRARNPDILNELLDVIEGAPKISLFEVVHSGTSSLVAQED